LLRDDPNVIPFIERIVLMGGSFCGGNVTSTAEFNIYTDPEAAELVFSAGIPITMASLDSTNTAVILPSEIQALHQGGKASKCIASLFDQYGALAHKRGMPGVRLHDVCAAAFLIEPSLFRLEHLPVQIETGGYLSRGMTIADRRPSSPIPPNAMVMTSVDRLGLIQLLWLSLQRLDILLK
jgi:pyrimidine-specific ribonucleoside hydrolase